MNPPQQKPPVGVSFVGIGAKTTDPARGGRHVSLIYSGADGEPRLSHLAWHCRLIDEPWDSTYVWCEAAGLDAVNVAVVASYLRSIDIGRPNVPYGFQFLGCRFETDPASGLIVFRSGAPGAGLTCATFVVLVFSSLSLPLLDPLSWPNQRDGDDAWRETIVDLLRRHGVAESRIRQIESSPPDVRIRPEDVLASASLNDWPVAYGSIAALLDTVIAELNAA